MSIARSYCVPEERTFTADQIRAEIEAVRAEFDTGPEEGGWSRIVLDALKVRLGLES